MEEYRVCNERYRIRLGYLPTRRNSGLSKVEAGRQKREIEFFLRTNYADRITLVTIDELNEEGIILDLTDATRAADIFQQAHVDAIFAPHCNFGTEDAVAKTGKLVGKPLLLWGPRDEAPDERGFRIRDTQCGLFATSKALLRYGVPFTYITNSELTSETFRRGLEDFLAVACVVKNFTGMRVGQIGVRPTPFTSVMCNESELLEKFGIEVVPTSVAEVVRDVYATIEAAGEEYNKTLTYLRESFRYLSASEMGLEKTAGLIVVIRKWAREKKIDTIAIQCWNAMNKGLGIYPCVASAVLTDEGLPISCETDVHGAISLMMLAAASMGKTSFLADLTVRHPEDDNVELLWHCGNFPPSLSTGGNELTDKGLHPCGLAAHWEIKGGDITVARMDSLNGKYQLLMGEAEGISGPANVGTYLWTRFNDWPLWENRFIYGPYIHHLGVVHGKFSHILYGACRYIKGLEPDAVYPEEESLKKMLLY